MIGSLRESNTYSRSFKLDLLLISKIDSVNACSKCFQTSIPPNNLRQSRFSTQKEAAFKPLATTPSLIYYTNLILVNQWLLHIVVKPSDPKKGVAAAAAPKTETVKARTSQPHRGKTEMKASGKGNLKIKSKLTKKRSPSISSSSGSSDSESDSSSSDAGKSKSSSDSSGASSDSEKMVDDTNPEEEEEKTEESAPKIIRDQLAKRIKKKEDMAEKRASIPSAKLIDEIKNRDDVEKSTCKVCYQAIYYPVQADDGDVKMKGENEFLTDSKALYTLAHCRHCTETAHWNCIGTDVSLLEITKDGETNYFFECDKCRIKAASSHQPGRYRFSFAANNLSEKLTCIACERDSGLLQSFEVNIEDGDEKFVLTCFCHPFCAMSFPEHFITKVTADYVRYTLKDHSMKNPLLQQRKEKALGQGKRQMQDPCALCNKSMGLMLKSSSQTEEGTFEQAHASCIIEQQYKDEFSDGQEKYTWCYQVLLDEDKAFQPEIRVASEDDKLKHCMCRQNQNAAMVQCDYCKIWYHFTCVDYVPIKRQTGEEDKGKDKDDWTCQKCVKWASHLDEVLVDMLFGYRDFQSFPNEDGVYWKGIDSLVNYMEDSDFAVQVPVRFFEHFLVNKVWHVLAQKMQEEVVHQELIDNHIQEAGYLFPIVDVQPLKNMLAKKIKIIEKIIVDSSYELTLKDLIASSNSSAPQISPQATRDQIEENMLHNSQAAEKAKEIEQLCMKEAKLITQSLLDLRQISDKSKILQRAYDLLSKSKKPQINIVKELCAQIDVLEFGQEGNKSTETLKKILKEYDQWVSESAEEFKRTTPEEEKLLERIKHIKQKRSGLKRTEALHAMFKEYFTKKTNLEQAHTIFQKSLNLAADISEESLHLEQLILLIQKIEKQIEEFERTQQKSENPLKQSFEIITEMCCFPIKGNNIEKFLDTWAASSRWTVQANYFLEDKLSNEQKDDPNLLADLIWTFDRADSLLAQALSTKEKPTTLFVDPNLVKRVKSKVNAIAKVKDAVKKDLKGNHDIRLLQDVLRGMVEMENIDFKHEISRVQEKIKLLIEVKTAIDNESHMKQSIEFLEGLYSRICEQEDSAKNEYPITIMWESKLMLKSRVQSAKGFKKEFHDLLETTYQNTFTKNMIHELRSIVNRGDREYEFDMRNEQKIIDNIPYSEEWFLHSYEKLKRVAGKGLHQVDFKDFVQLSTVLTDEKECVQLLKGLNKPPESLVGAAQNLWKSISGVKWLFEAKRLLRYQQTGGGLATGTDEIELNKVVELDVRAREIFGIKYEVEEKRGTTYSELFRQFSNIVASIRQFEEKFGNYQKLIKTLESNYDRLDDFRRECEELTKVLKDHNVTSASGELDLLSKIHTYIDFLHRYQQLTAPLKHIQDQEEEKATTSVDTTSIKHTFKLEYSTAMIIQQMARDQGVPEDLSILRKLRESVARFEKFQREYSDYKRYRSRLVQGNNQVSRESRFTTGFLQRLLDEQTALDIQQSTQDDEDMYFDREMIRGDLEKHSQVKAEAEGIFSQLEDEDVSLSEDKELRIQFEEVRQHLYSLPVFERDLSMRCSIYEWMYSSSDMLSNGPETEVLSIGSWDSKIKQADTYSEQLKSYQGGTTSSGLLHLLRSLKNHPIYQRLLWEVDQARQVNEFVSMQRTHLKTLAAKYHTSENQRQQAFNMSYLFKNKNPRYKVEKYLELAQRSKVDLSEEIRHLTLWLKEYDEFMKQYEDDTLFTSNSYDRLKDMAKQMFICPVDLSDLYIKLKPRLETAEAIKLDLKRIVQDHEQAQQGRGGDGRPIKRLRYSRIQPSLQIYNKECKIPGIREIDSVLEKVQQSKDRLSKVQALSEDIALLGASTSLSAFDLEAIRERIETGKRTMNEIEIDMEKKEVDVRRQLFEANLKYIVFPPEVQDAKKRRKIDFEDFKLYYEREYDLLRNSLVDDTLHGKFVELKNKVSELSRKINKIETREDLQRLQEEVERECPLIDFSQTLTDKDAYIQLGKRPPQVPSRKNSEQISSRKPSSLEDESESDEESKEKTKKRQRTDGQAPKKSESEEESSSDSESGRSSGSSSSSSEDSSSSGSSSSGSEESKSEQQSLAQNRARRNIVPNLSSDFIYSKSSLKTQQKMAQQSGKRPPKKDEKSSSSEEEELETEEQRLARRKAKKEKRRKLEEKKKQLQKQFKEHKQQQRVVDSHLHQVQGQASGSKRLAVPMGLNTEPMTEGQVFMANLKQDSVLMNSLASFKEKIREDSRKKIRDSLKLEGSVFATLEQGELNALAYDFEDELNKKHPELDHYYRKRINDICANLRLLKNFKDVGELIAIKKAISIGKLLLDQYAFKNDIEKLDQKIQSRRQQLKEMGKLPAAKPKPQQPPSLQQQISDAQQQRQSEEAKAIQEKKSHSLPIVKTQPADDFGQAQSQNNVSDDDLESYDSNPALFSDNDEEAKADPMTNIQNILKEVNNQQKQQMQRQVSHLSKTSSSGAYDPTSFQQHDMMQRPNQTPYQQGQTPTAGFGFPEYPRIQYNPYEIFEARHLGIGAGYGRLPPKKPSEPVMYDPAKAQKSVNKERTVAPACSLLRVWEGSIELAKDNVIKCQLQSNIDVNAFQSLPDMPGNLMLKGKAKLQDVTQHFLRLKKDKRLIKGWAIRKNMLHQENNDKYTKLFDELDQTERSALFNVFQGVTLYLVPITSKTRDFVQQMGVDLEKLMKDSNQWDPERQLPVDHQIRATEDIRSLEEESHCYAFFSQIKQDFTHKSTYLNPDVLKYAKQTLEKPLFKSQDALFSPITSDEEYGLKGQSKRAAAIPQDYKQEEQLLFGGVSFPNPSTLQAQAYGQVYRGQDPRLRDAAQPVQSASRQDEGYLIQNPNEDDESQRVDIDALISSLRKETNLQVIQTKIFSVIHKVKGEEEAKLTQFLQELIQNLNNPLKQQTAPIVKSEETQQPIDPSTMGYSFPQGLGGMGQSSGGYRPQMQMQNPQMMGQQGQRFQQQGMVPGQQPQGQFMQYRQQFSGQNPPQPFQVPISGIRPGPQGPPVYGQMFQHQPPGGLMMPGQQQGILPPGIRPPPGQSLPPFGASGMIRPPPTAPGQPQQPPHWSQQPPR